MEAYQINQETIRHLTELAETLDFVSQALLADGLTQNAHYLEWEASWLRTYLIEGVRNLTADFKQ